MRILVVEDDVDISALVKAMLGREGHVVEVATTGDDGLWMATEFDFDVVVLDWALPPPDGVTICRELRERQRWMPILMLTGNSAVDQRVAGLQAGADDYLTKPFAVEELVARVQALGRRSPVERPTVLRAGDLVLDPSSRQVSRGGTPIALRPKEYSLLELFMRRAGEVLDRAEILDRVWDLHFDGMSNVVDVHVKSLRNKIDKPFGRTSIETVWRVGYRLAAEGAPDQTPSPDTVAAAG
ncbi:MAG TPA: response regulator transcription factor [Aquihabitans sp.]|jgi:two-component system OmpR family response regulator|nr:response regulator transcription factor [Aquihabitans sp.]